MSPTCAVNASAEPRRTSDRRTATAPATHKRSDRTRPPRHNELRGAPRLPRSGRAAGHRSWAPPAATSTSAQQAAGPHLDGFFVHSGRPGWVPAAAIARQGPGARKGGEDAVALVRAAPDGHREDPPPGGVGPLEGARRVSGKRAARPFFPYIRTRHFDLQLSTSKVLSSVSPHCRVTESSGWN